MKKLIVIALALLLFSSAFAILASTAKATFVEPNYIAIKDAPVGPKTNTGVTEDDPFVAATDPPGYYPIGTVLTWIYANLAPGHSGYYSRSFQLVGMTAHAEMWLSATGFGWPAGDPRPTPVITTAEWTFLLNEFETQIYPTDVAYFGSPAVRTGSGAAFGPPSYYTDSPRVVLLVMNIRDQNYYDPTYPYYVVGYFDTGVQYYTDRNVVTIDSLQWERRLGPAGTVWPPPAPVHPGGVDRPFVMDSTIAHEFQHLIHADWNPSDPSFMNEGCSMFAEYLNGFGIDPTYLNSYFYTPDNSLIEWGDQGDINILADYGESALWSMYLSDHYGGAATISYFVQAGIPGIDGVNNALAHFGYTDRFDDVYRDFKLANLIRSDSPGGGKYNYHNIDLNDPSIDPINLAASETGAPIPWTTGTSFGNTMTILGYDTGVSMLGPYGSDYVQFTDWPGYGTISYDGNATAVLGWTLSGGVWWSGVGNMINVQLTGPAHVSPGDPTLTLVTAYGIETQWDFGFVQVSTDHGHTWTSLSNAYTTSTYLTDVAAIQNNLPGLTDYNPDWPSYTTMSFDLTSYAGMDIQVCFRYMTDEFTNYEGWYIQSATVSSTPLTLTATYPSASFQVDLVRISHGQTSNAEIVPLHSPSGSVQAYAADGFSLILVVSGINHAGLDDYRFMVQPLQTTVGGEWTPVNDVTLLVPHSVVPLIGLASALILATASVIYVKHKKKRQD